MNEIPQWFSIMFVGVILSVIGWGIKRLLEGQDTGVKELKEISTSVTKICGNIEVVSQKLADSKETCDERHKNNQEEHIRIMERLEKL